MGHTSCSLRMVVVHETASHDLKVLVREEERGGVKTTRLPVCLFSHDDGGGIIANTVQKLLKVVCMSCIIMECMCENCP